MCSSDLNVKAWYRALQVRHVYASVEEKLISKTPRHVEFEQADRNPGEGGNGSHIEQRPDVFRVVNLPDRNEELRAAVHVNWNHNPSHDRNLFLAARVRTHLVFLLLVECI